MFSTRLDRFDGPRTACSIAAALVITFSSAVLAAQNPGRIDGTMTVDGQSIPLTHAVIYAEDEGFYQPDDPTWTLVLTESEISARDADDMFIDPSLRIGITWTAEFGDEPKLEVLSQTLRVGDLSASGGTYPSLEITSRDDGAWVGRVAHTEEQEFFDHTYQYDLRFHAPMVDPNALVGDPLPDGGGEPGEAYLRWTEAIHSGDLDALRKLVPADMAAMLDEPDAAESLEMMAMMTPQNVRILEGVLNGDEAMLLIEGTIEDEPVTGEITLMRQGDFWLPTGSSVQ